MNIDRGQENFTDAEIADLRQWLADLKVAQGESWRSLGQRVGVPEGTISQWVPGRYTGDNAKIAYKVKKFQLNEGARLDLELQAPEVPSFQSTATARRIMGQLRWAQRGKMVIIVGAAGVGKTGAIKQYAATSPNSWVATMNPATRRPTPMLVELMRAIGVTARGGGTLQTLLQVLSDRLMGTKALLIFDEAQHLHDDAVELIRSIHDSIGVGVALAGNPTVLTRIQGGPRQADFAQIASRISMPHVYGAPDPEDITVLCLAWGVTHPKEREFLTKIAELPGHLRNLTQTLELATLLARQQDDERTLDHIKAAWRQKDRRAAAL